MALQENEHLQGNSGFCKKTSALQRAATARAGNQPESLSRRTERHIRFACLGGVLPSLGHTSQQGRPVTLNLRSPLSAVCFCHLSVRSRKGLATHVRLIWHCFF